MQLIPRLGVESVEICPGIKWDGRGLLIADTVTGEDWAGLVFRLLDLREKLTWAIGDALGWGELHRPEQFEQVFDRGELGDRFEQVATWIRVASRIPREARHPALTWSAHRAVSHLPDEERDRWLDRAEAESWGSNALETEVRAAARDLPEPGPLTGERYQLVHCEVSTLSGRIEPGSVDVIVTDPPYGAESVHLYGELGRLARHALKPGGCAVVLTGQHNLPAFMAALGEHLGYFWMLAYSTPGKSATVWTRPYLPQWKPVLVYVNGEPYSGPRHVSDVVTSERREKENHVWEQSMSGTLALVERAARPGQTILDPFCGSGTTGVAALAHNCRFIGADVDEAALATAAGRLNEAAILSEADAMAQTGEATWIT